MDDLRQMREVICLAALLFVCVWGGCACFASVALPDSKNRSPITCEVAAEGTLTVSGRMQAPGLTNRNVRAGILLVRYYSADGKELPAKDIPFTQIFKCGYKYLAAGMVAESFAYGLGVPEGAVRAEISVSKFACKGEILLSDFNL